MQYSTTSPRLSLAVFSALALFAAPCAMAASAPALVPAPSASTAPAAAPAGTAPAPAATVAPASPAMTILQGLPEGTYAVFKTNLGEFAARLFTKEAPLTTANFIGLANGTKAYTDPRTGQPGKGPYYDGTTFHRVIKGFMLQGGDPAGTGRGGPGFEIRDEFAPGLKHDKAGLLSMANRGANTGGSQFFVTVAPTPWLDGKHAIFGEVVKGMDVVMKISEVPTTGQSGGDRPLTPVVIEKLTIATVPAAATR